MKINWPFGIVCFATGIALGIGISKRPINVPLPDPVEANENSGIERHGGPKKPGGIIEALKIPFNDSPLVFIDRPTRLQKPHWFFEKFSVAQLTDFLRNSFLTPNQLNDLAKTSRVEIATNGCLVTPSEYLVRSLSPASHSKIYATLETSPFNYAQQFPFRFGTKDFESRFEGSDLSPEKLQVIRGLTYTNSDDLCLTDLQSLSLLLSTNEFDRAMDALYRFPVYRLRLRVMPGSNVDLLKNYWGRGGREDKIRPLISSLAKVPRKGGSSINISYLLPPFARLRLYTFPNSWKEATVEKQDCFWSAMNFFNDQPDLGFLEPNYTKQILESHYRVVQGDPTFGDLLTLVDTNGTGYHICVYLVDHFVFTKNGVNTLSPWVIMKLSDMLLFFPTEDAHKFVIYRRKDLS